MRAINTTALTTTVGLFLAGLLAWYTYTHLQAELNTALVLLLAILVLGAAVAVGISLVMLWDRAGAGYEQRLRARAEREAFERQSKLLATVTKPGEILYLTHFDGLKTLTVNPTVSPASHVNGIYVEPSETEVAAWQSYHALHATARPALPAGRDASSDGPPLLGSGSDLPPLLPRLVNSQRLIIAGGSDSGKTTVVKHLIAARPNHQTIIIDPHSPSKILGIDTIGAGRDYEAIANALEALVLLMSDRYQDVKRGLFGYGQHQPVAVFVDEWTSIGREVERAGEMLAVLLTESRKVNIFLTVIAHSLTNDILRVDNQIKRSAVQVELFGGNGEPHRAFIHPNTTIGPDGRKATPQEFALPGPFVEPARPATLVRYLPDPKIIRAQMMAGEGKSPTAIAREYFATDRPNGNQIKEVQQLLSAAERARQTNGNGTTPAAFQAA